MLVKKYVSISFKGYDVRIIDDNCNEVSKGQEGNIAVYCDPSQKQGGLFSGYVDNDEMTKKVFSNDYYFTGDRGFMDEDDYIWFSSRDDDVIIRLVAIFLKSFNLWKFEPCTSKD